MNHSDLLIVVPFLFVMLDAILVMFVKPISDKSFAFNARLATFGILFGMCGAMMSNPPIFIGLMLALGPTFALNGEALSLQPDEQTLDELVGEFVLNVLINLYDVKEQLEKKISS